MHFTAHLGIDRLTYIQRSFSTGIESLQTFLLELENPFRLPFLLLLLLLLILLSWCNSWQ